MRPFSQYLLQPLGYGNSASDHYHVNVVGWSLQKNVAYIAANDVTIDA